MKMTKIGLALSGMAVASSLVVTQPVGVAVAATAPAALESWNKSGSYHAVWVYEGLNCKGNYNVLFPGDDEAARRSSFKANYSMNVGVYDYRTRDIRYVANFTKGCHNVTSANSIYVYLVK